MLGPSRVVVACTCILSSMVLSLRLIDEIIIFSSSTPTPSTFAIVSGPNPIMDPPYNISPMVPKEGPSACM